MPTVTIRTVGGKEVEVMLLRAQRGVVRGRVASVKEAVERLRDRAEDISPYDTGTLAGAHEGAYKDRGMDCYGVVFISPYAHNPRGEQAQHYGPYVHELDWQHAFYDRTVEDVGHVALNLGLDAIVHRIW